MCGSFRTSAASGLPGGRKAGKLSQRPACDGSRYNTMDGTTFESLWVHGGLSLVAGIIILMFPKLFFYLIGGFLLVNGGVAFFHGGSAIVGGALAVAGILILLLPKLVSLLVGFYLIIIGLLLSLTGAGIILGAPLIIIGIVVMMVPNIVAYLIGAVLAIGGGITLFTTFVQ